MEKDKVYMLEQLGLFYHRASIRHNIGKLVKYLCMVLVNIPNSNRSSSIFCNLYYKVYKQEKYFQTYQ
jgi:hypothetical protein